MTPTVIADCALTRPAKPPAATPTPAAPRPLITSRRCHPDCAMSLLLSVLKVELARNAPREEARRMKHLLVYKQAICQKNAVGRRERAPQAVGRELDACAGWRRAAPSWGCSSPGWKPGLHPCYSDSLIRRPAADCSGRAFIG